MMVMGLSAAQMTTFQAAANALLPDTCIIQQDVQTNDGAGGVVSTYTAIGTVSCRIAPLLRRDVVLEVVSDVKVKIDYTLFVPYGTSILPHQRVIHNGNTYEIVGLSNEHDWGVYVTAYISRMA